MYSSELLLAVVKNPTNLILVWQKIDQIGLTFPEKRLHE